MENSTADFDDALIASALALIAAKGWKPFTVSEAARRADLPLPRVRARFASRIAVLVRFQTRLDQSCLTGALTDGPVRDRLFDIVMRRIDGLQAHRAGVLALLRDLRWDPLTALALTPCALRSMAWMLSGVGLDTTGLPGELRTKGMLVLWIHTVRAWQKDETEDLSATMAALDQGLTRASQAEATMAEMMGSKSTPLSEDSAEPPVGEPPAGDPTPEESKPEQ